MTVTGFVRLLAMREDQFTLLDSAFERSLFRFVEHSVVIGVVAGDLGIYVADVIDHHLDVRLLAMRRDVNREFHCAISDGFGESFFFLVVQLAIFVRVERGDFGVERCQMRGKGSGITMMLRVMAGGVSVMNLSDAKAAYGKAACDYGCECFEVFHISMCCGLISPP
jgi:hypothetical protein